ncbi:DUF2177 family protein [uncultured Martelella sp.]|uniref:DUF2177 family protein n=1 Tax=uncultured Martelella sp. TaxID=392331 RepID=UPI0029C64840|nr:DUF2177 family protein [uncultured Martelella sp.]
MNRSVTAFLVMAVCFSLLDFIWLGTVAFSFYEAEIGSLLLASPNWYAGLTFYGMYLIGIYYFSVYPGVKAGSWRKGLVNGAVFGLMAYGTYDLTNMATLKDWSWAVVGVDMAWGMFATGLTGLVSCLVTGWIAGRRV